MKRLLLLIVFSLLECFLLISKSYGFSYIDNPNFDLGFSGWHKKSVNIKSYEYCEVIRQTEIRDVFFAMNMHKKRNEWGKIWYVLENPLSATPLFFVVEAAFSGIDKGEMQIELVEYIPVMRKPPSKRGVRNLRSSQPVIPVTEAANDDTLGKVLIRKRLVLHNEGQWNQITSDYPVYRSDRKSYIYLRIKFKSNSGDFNINYAQVGNDPRNLGGRGTRDWK